MNPEQILRSDSTVNDSQRADAFDAYHTASSHVALAEALEPIPLSSVTKQMLIDAKRTENPVISALREMTTIPLEILDAAEARPNVFKAMFEHYRGEK